MKTIHETLTYGPEMWTVRKDDIYAAISALDSGLHFARELLLDHDARLGRTTSKNKWWAEEIEMGIRAMEKALAGLKALPKAEPACQKNNAFFATEQQAAETQQKAGST